MPRRAAGAALAAALALGPGGLRAQEAADARELATADGVAFTVTLHAGGTAFTRFQYVTLEAADSPQGDYPAALSASTAAAVGADITLWFQTWLGVRVNFLYAPSSFEVLLTEEDREEVLGEASDYQRLDYSDVSLFSLTASATLALPVKSGRVAPYALLGVGGALLAADGRGAQGLDAAFDGRRVAAGLTGIAGLGLKIPLTDGRVALSFEITDHVMRSPVPSNDARVLLDTGALRVVNVPHPGGSDTNAHYTHAVGVTAGLTFATGARTPADFPVEPVPQ